jgi:hypothetical protein
LEWSETKSLGTAASNRPLMTDEYETLMDDTVKFINESLGAFLTLNPGFCYKGVMQNYIKKLPCS